MPAISAEREAVVGCFRRFLTSLGRTDVALTSSTHLVRDLGMTSEDGLDFALELCDEFKFEFPETFNPFIQDNGRRGRRLGEMIDAVAIHLSAKP
jgi:hypothetical protein